MKPFKFTLQPVKTVRQHREQEAMEAYARGLLERSRALARLEAAERSLSAAQAEWQQVAQQGCRAADLSQRALHCQALARQRDERGAALAAAERKANALLQQMLRARQQREVVDHFLDRQKAAYDRALTREDQKFLDELARRRPEAGWSARGESNGL